MMNNDFAVRVKQYLEELYDIPFDVRCSVNYGDTQFNIRPHNNVKELFDVVVKFRNRLRLIIEVVPERYAAFSIRDMAEASNDRKARFSEYAEQLNERKAKVDFIINDTVFDPTRPDSWPSAWENYRLRVSRSPICAEDEALNEAEVAASWSAIVIGMFLSLLHVIQIESEEYYEGGLRKTETNRYERNPINRKLCLAANGYTCKICGFDFEKRYGSIGHHYIHVHHIVPVSKMNEAYVLNPIKDLIPVCPNCHAMLHRSDPPLLPADLQMIIRQNTDTDVTEH